MVGYGPETSGNGGGSGQQGTGYLRGQGGVGPGDNSNGVSEQTRRILAQQQGRNNGLDFYALSQVSGVSNYQEPLPPLDFSWTWQSRNGLQRGWRLTINSWRGGLNLQRGRLNAGHLRTAESSLVSHARDEAILPLATVAQRTLPINLPGARMLHTKFQGREWMGGWFGDATIYGETSVSDPTVTPLLSWSGTFLYSVGTATISGEEHLIVMTGQGAYFLKGTPVAQVAGPLRFTDKDGTAWTGLNFIQSPIPGNPLLIRTANGSRPVLAQSVEVSADNGNVYTQQTSVMLHSAGLYNSFPLGFGRIGNLQPAAYWLEEDNSSYFNTRIGSVNAYGTQYQEHVVSITHIIGATFVRARGLIAMTDGRRVMTWSGKEEDLQIFADPPSRPGYILFCNGLYEEDGALYAEVNELPFSTGGFASGTMRACRWRYDFEFKKWFQISEWITMSAGGQLGWQSGFPSPQIAGGGGYISAWGGPDLPFGPITRAMHGFAWGEWPASSSAPVTWFHKPEPVAGINPYSLRGGDQAFALTGTVRSPALIWEPGYEYVNKYVDGIEWGGQDTGGAGSSITIRIGEGGTLDQTAGPLHRTFVSPINQMDRRQKWPDNQTALLFPQIELTLTRGVSNETPQGLPFTIYGHVDLPEADQAAPWMPPDRSLG